MADTKVSALPASGALVAGDLLYTVAGGISSKSTVTQVQTAVTAGFTPANRLINTTSPLAGGGDLSADRTLTIADAAADGVTKGAAAFLAADFNSAAGVISIDYTNGQSASAVNKGFLTAADFVTFSSGSLPVVDTTAVVKGSGDPTKLLRFEVDGFTAGATRILTPPNANATIAGLQIAQTFTEVQTFTPGDNLIPIVIAAGSVTGAGTSPFLNMSGTWNTTGAPDAIRLTVTDTASNAAANLIDLMVGAASLFAVRKDGRATVAGDALIAGAASPAITSIRVSVGAAAAQNVIRINGNSTADNAPVLDFLRSGNREWTFAPISNSFFISNSGGVANFNDATLNATPNWEFTSTGALKLNLGTVATGLLHVNTNTSGAGLTIFEQASADTDCYDLSFRKTRGTVAVPTVITVGDELGKVMFRGYSGAGGYVTGASITAVSTGTIATTRVASSLVFATGTDAAPTVLTDRLTINNTGQVMVVAPGTTALPAIGFTSEATGLANVTAAVMTFVVNGSARAHIASNSLRLHSVNATLEWGGTNVAAGDMVLARDAADVFAQRRTTNIQTARWYETFTDASNYSRSTLTTQAGNHLFRTESAGTGTLRILQVGTGPSTGTDIAGVNTILHSGQATGSGLPGAILFQQSLPVGGSGSSVTALATSWQINTSGTLVGSFPLRLKGYTVATLPAGPVQGDVAFVTDALTPTFLTAAVGGGAVVSTVLYNGTTWVTV